MITVGVAHVVCAALVLTDLAARAWRIEWLLRGTGTRISFWQAIEVNALGDAACALTPMRIGGEPSRVWGMLRVGVPAPAAFLTISVEILAAWPVILLAALGLTLAYAPEWMATAIPRIEQAARGAAPWIALAVAASVVAWVVAKRWARHPAARQLGRPLKRVRVYWRRMPRWPVAASVPMTALNLMSRTGMLVALALAEPSGMGLGPLLFGSFILLYAQLILPTPSGAGIVDLGVLGGAAGELGAATLFWWRLYSNGVGVVLGGLVLARWWLVSRRERRVKFGETPGKERPAP